MLAPNTTDHALTPPSGNEGFAAALAFTSDFGSSATAPFEDERYAWVAIWTKHVKSFQ
jgi:hypothetical protein